MTPCSGNSSAFICVYDVDDGVSFFFFIFLCVILLIVYSTIHPASTARTTNESRWLVGASFSSFPPLVDHHHCEWVTMTRWWVVLILPALQRSPRPPTSHDDSLVCRSHPLHLSSTTKTTNKWQPAHPFSTETGHFQQLASWSQTHISKHHNTFIRYRTRFQPSVAIRTHYRPLSRVSDLQHVFLSNNSHLQPSSTAFNCYQHHFVVFEPQHAFSAVYTHF